MIDTRASVAFQTVTGNGVGFFCTPCQLVTVSRGYRHERTVPRHTSERKGIVHIHANGTRIRRSDGEGGRAVLPEIARRGGTAQAGIGASGSADAGEWERGRSDA